MLAGRRLLSEGMLTDCSAFCLLLSRNAVSCRSAALLLRFVVNNTDWNAFSLLLVWVFVANTDCSAFSLLSMRSEAFDCGVILLLRVGNSTDCNAFSLLLFASIGTLLLGPRLLLAGISTDCSAFSLLISMVEALVCCILLLL